MITNTLKWSIIFTCDRFKWRILSHVTASREIKTILKIYVIMQYKPACVWPPNQQLLDEQFTNKNRCPAVDANTTTYHVIDNTTAFGNIMFDRPAGEKQLMMGNANWANDSYQSWFTRTLKTKKRGIDQNGLQTGAGLNNTVEEQNKNQNGKLQRTAFYNLC